VYYPRGISFYRLDLECIVRLNQVGDVLVKNESDRVNVCKPKQLVSSEHVAIDFLHKACINVAVNSCRGS
jgi:hypothetical protein